MVADEKFLREFRHVMLRTLVQSVFVSIFNDKKKKDGLSQSKLAEKMGVNRSVISRSLADPPNWTIDKISDMAEAMNVDLEVIARDRDTGICHTARGRLHMAFTTGKRAPEIVENKSPTLSPPSMTVTTADQFVQRISVRVAT